jgi:hypothetical protein
MISSEIKKVTPEYARKLLSNNPSNRPMLLRHVNNLASSMRRGEWQLNGESIKISECGVLLDGQHRLSAIVKTGAPVDMVVISGLPLSSFHTINVGARVRTAADVLSIAGEKNYNDLAAGARIFKCWEINKSAPQFQGFTVSVAEIEDVISRHPKIRNFSSYKRSELKRMLTGSIVCFLGYVFHEANYEKADSFFDGLARGTGLESGSPILLLRDRLLANSLATAKLPREVICALTIKAFNAHVDGRQVGILRYSENEKFPLIVGA